MKGIIKRLQADKGFGFIEDQKHKSYFFHKSSLKNAYIDSVEIGQEVEFEPEESEKGPRAANVHVS